jgi:hypothetical protein
MVPNGMGQKRPFEMGGPMQGMPHGMDPMGGLVPMGPQPGMQGMQPQPMGGPPPGMHGGPMGIPAQLPPGPQLQPMQPMGGHGGPGPGPGSLALMQAQASQQPKRPKTENVLRQVRPGGGGGAWLGVWRAGGAAGRDSASRHRSYTIDYIVAGRDSASHRGACSAGRCGP